MANEENVTNENKQEKQTDNRASDNQQNKQPSRQRKPQTRRRPYNKRRPSGTPKQKGPVFRKISVVIPLLNEEESLRPLFAEIKKAVKPLKQDHEIIFIDDGSSDKSLEILKNIAALDNKVKFISFRKNYGKSAALHVGFQEVTGDVTITMDADLQDDPAEIPNLIAKLEEGFDLVSGWKKKRYDPFIKRTTSKFFNYVTKVSSNIDIHDFNCGLKAYRSEVVKSIKVYGELHRYIPVLAAWQGFKISEIPVLHHPRRYGKTKFGISRFFKGFVDLITVIFTTRYIRRPMHLFGFLGALSFLMGLIVNIYLTISWFVNHIALSNRPLLFLGMLLIIVGVQFFSVGLLGEMMVHNAKDERDYSIKDKN